MLQLASYDIVFQEIPGEVTLALNISGCPNRCKGCHSPHLQQDTGEKLTQFLLLQLLESYSDSVTCVCFMGGDADPQAVCELAELVKASSSGRLRTGWYSGKNFIPENFLQGRFDYLKLGPYIECKGGLGSETSNQKFYRIEQGNLIDITYKFINRSTLVNF